MPNLHDAYVLTDLISLISPIHSWTITVVFIVWTTLILYPLGSYPSGSSAAVRFCHCNLVIDNINQMDEMETFWARCIDVHLIKFGLICSVRTTISVAIFVRKLKFITVRESKQTCESRRKLNNPNWTSDQIRPDVHLIVYIVWDNQTSLFNYLKTSAKTFYDVYLGTQSIINQCYQNRTVLVV